MMIGNGVFVAFLVRIAFEIKCISQGRIDQHGAHCRRDRDHGANGEIYAARCNHQCHSNCHQHERRPVVENVNDIAVQMVSVHGVLQDAKFEETWINDGIKYQDNDPGHKRPE